MCIYIHNYTDSLTRFKQFTRVRIVKSRYYLKAIIKDKGKKCYRLTMEEGIKWKKIQKRIFYIK